MWILGPVATNVKTHLDILHVGLKNYEHYENNSLGKVRIMTPANPET
jgi:hypothetical protein